MHYHFLLFGILAFCRVADFHLLGLKRFESGGLRPQWLFSSRWRRGRSGSENERKSFLRDAVDARQVQAVSALPGRHGPRRRREFGSILGVMSHLSTLSF